MVALGDIRMKYEQVTLSIAELIAPIPEYLRELTRGGDFYKQLYADVKENGFINPFLITRNKNGSYKMWTGNKRALVGFDLGIEQAIGIVLPDSRRETIRAIKRELYTPIDPFDDSIK